MAIVAVFEYRFSTASLGQDALAVKFMGKESEMKRFGGAVIILALFMSGTVAACGDGTYPVMSTRKDDGTKVGIFLSQSQLERTQAWNPDQGEPPLSFSAAYRVARDWARRRYARYDDVKLSDLSLKRYGCSLAADRWYYIVTLQPVIDGNQVWSSGSWVAILFDGTLVEPREY